MDHMNAATNIGDDEPQPDTYAMEELMEQNDPVANAAEGRQGVVDTQTLETRYKNLKFEIEFERLSRDRLRAMKGLDPDNSDDQPIPNNPPVEQIWQRRFRVQRLQVHQEWLHSRNQIFWIDQAGSSSLKSSLKH